MAVVWGLTGIMPLSRPPLPLLASASRSRDFGSVRDAGREVLEWLSGFGSVPCRAWEGEKRGVTLHYRQLRGCRPRWGYVTGDWGRDDASASHEQLGIRERFSLRTTMVLCVALNSLEGLRRLGNYLGTPPSPSRPPSEKSIPFQGRFSLELNGLRRAAHGREGICAMRGVLTGAARRMGIGLVQTQFSDPV
ncbi:hypothetical protein GQ53DRAFT_154063 [Thozetella sp. PMI_491]|nr:hypothetical protein GQ53DRAFT_154063 [Thozetella sp. PMI_491]